MVSGMVRFFVLRIRTGKMTLDDVPPRWRDEVKEALES